MTDFIEVKDLIVKQGDDIEKFISRNDDRLSKLEGGLDNLYKKANRPSWLGGGQEKSEHYEMFTGYLRHGDNEKALRDWQGKSMSMFSDPDGGYLVPDELSNDIDTLMRDMSPMRQVAKVVQVDSENIRFVIGQSDMESGWVSESEARPDTDSGTLALIRPAFGEVYCCPKVTAHLLEDSAIDLDSFLVEDISDKFSADEGTAFITGNGVGRPKGITVYDTSSSADGSRDFGTVQYIAAGASGAFATGAGYDKLIDLVHSLKPAHRMRGTWLLNSSTLAVIRKLTDSNGDPLWRQALSADQPSTLLGYPVLEDENMPDISANSLSIAFGDFMRGYIICDRIGMAILRDPYTSKGFVKFYVRKRVGGGVLNSEAFKFIKFSAS